MAAGAADQPPEGVPMLNRTCHLCEQAVESHVWYAKNAEEGRRKNKHTKRVYACPSCYFDLAEDERTEYYRERV